MLLAIVPFYEGNVPHDYGDEKHRAEGIKRASV